MPTFDFRFIKTICDDTGHQHTACQSHLQVNAQNETDALRSAGAEFCRIKKTNDWSIYADAIELRRPDRPRTAGRWRSSPDH